MQGQSLLPVLLSSVMLHKPTHSVLLRPHMPGKSWIYIGNRLQLTIEASNHQTFAIFAKEAITQFINGPLFFLLCSQH